MNVYSESAALFPLFIAVALAGPAIGGCSHATHDAPALTAAPDPSSQSASLPVHAEIRRRTLLAFQRAAVGKPGDTDAGDALKLAPLFAVESGDGGVALPFSDSLAGSTIHDSLAARPATAPAASTIYFERSTTRIGNRSHPQWAYYWRHRAAAALDGRIDGIRMTLGDDGWPMVFERFASSEGVVTLFVSESLERAAVKAYGGPLPGRQFSVERSIDEQPRVVVARLIADGPMPMGPWVYVSSDGRVTTLLCRCSPSQVADNAGGAAYDLRAVAQPDAPDRPGWRDERWIERALRWPG